MCKAQTMSPHPSCSSSATPPSGTSAAQLTTKSTSKNCLSSKALMTTLTDQEKVQLFDAAHAASTVSGNDDVQSNVDSSGDDVQANLTNTYILQAAHAKDLSLDQLLNSTQHVVELSSTTRMCLTISDHVLLQLSCLQMVPTI